MSRNRIAPIVLLIFGSICGCAADPDPPTLTSWQQSLEKYVWDRGNGDPNVVADLSWDDVHKGFAVIGDAVPDRSTDQIGLLVAHRSSHGKPYFVFLLGTIRHDTLENLRPVALQVGGEAFHWTVGQEDPRSLSLYRAWSDADRKRQAAEKPIPPPFPRVEETFQVTVENDAFVIRHAESGAQWEVRPISMSATRGAEPLRD